MVLFSYDISIFKFMVFIYACIRILDLKLENSYENGPKDKIKIKKKTKEDKRPIFFYKTRVKWHVKNRGRPNEVDTPLL